MSFLAKNYNRKKIAFTKGKGSYLFSTNGKKEDPSDKEEIPDFIEKKIRSA